MFSPIRYVMDFEACAFVAMALALPGLLMRLANDRALLDT
jgi:hypothetical protein